MGGEAQVENPMRYFPGSSDEAARCLTTEQGRCVLSPLAGSGMGWRHAYLLWKVAHFFAAEVCIFLLRSD